MNGLRYRVRSKLPGKPDIVFLRQRLAVFIDGDFWHGNAWRVRGLQSFDQQFVNRSKWWIAKITRNIERDDEVNRMLLDLGWTVLRFWESQTLADPNGVSQRIADVIRDSGSRPFQVVPLTDVERRRLASVRKKARPDTGISPEGDHDS